MESKWNFVIITVFKKKWEYRLVVFKISVTFHLVTGEWWGIDFWGMLSLIETRKFFKYSPYV